MTDDQMVACLPMVRVVARRLRCAKVLPASIENEDLVSAGTLGLVDAASRFDATRQTRFQTFAGYRVRGAMLDYVRDQAPLSRRQYARAKAEIAVGAYHYSLDEVPEPEAPRSDLDGRLIGPRLARALASLSTRDRYVVNAYFFEERTFPEIGRALGIGPSRASQVLKAALIRIRSALSAPARAPAADTTTPLNDLPRTESSPIPRSTDTPCPSGGADCQAPAPAPLRAKHLKGYHWLESTLPPAGRSNWTRTENAKP